MRAVLERFGPASVLRVGTQRVRVALGRGGVRTDKREGDGATPLGLLALRRVLYRADRIATADRDLLARGGLPSRPITRSDGWCDDPDHADYNTAVTLPHAARHEHLWREDGLYDIVGVLGWNDDPVIRGRGSAIFLHLATSEFTPTEGCLAIAKPDLLALLGTGLSEIEVV